MTTRFHNEGDQNIFRKKADIWSFRACKGIV